MTSSKILLEKIRGAFPIVEMPPKERIIFHDVGDGYFDGLLADIEVFRGRPASLELIRLLHQELSNLSLDMWLWVLPYYLEYCLTPEAEYSQMEVEFLIYALSPLPKYRSDVLRKLSALNKSQVDCLIDFVEWCRSHKYWQEYFSNELDQAKDFLGQVSSHASP